MRGVSCKSSHVADYIIQFAILTDKISGLKYVETIPIGT